MMKLVMPLAVWLLFSLFGSLELSFLVMGGVLVTSLFSPVFGPSLCSSGAYTVGGWGFCLILLTLYLGFLVLGYSSFVGGQSLSHFVWLNGFMVLVVLGFFSISNMFIFYILFELSILPIFAIIMGWGYQSERLSASLSMMFYTLTASMPLLLLLLLLFKVLGVVSLPSLASFSSSGFWSSLLFFSALMAFAVKLPMYGVHIWLPKAHVEAPVQGSMMLAAILLKLGGFGLYVFSPLVFSALLNKILAALSIIGMAIVGVLCGRLTDMKMVVAYSSVAHMSMVIYPLLLGGKVGVLGTLLMMLAHGLVSSCLFMMVYVIYLRSHSRSVLLSSGILNCSWILGVFWFIALGMNLAAPPSLNFVSEVFALVPLLSLSQFSVMVLLVSVMGASVYTFIMYSSVAQGRGVSVTHYYPLTLVEMVVMLSHLTWPLAMILSLDMF